MRKTKIICTIGPASDSEEMLTELAKAGMNVARLNFSHGTHEEHLERIRLSTRLLVIRKNAFQSCISLSDIALPASLQEIDKAAFSACPELPAVTDFLRRKEAEAKDAEYLRSRRPVWRRQGRCQYCGGWHLTHLRPACYIDASREVSEALASGRTSMI
jgi:hypothetical protein